MSIANKEKLGKAVGKMGRPDTRKWTENGVVNERKEMRYVKYT